MTRLRAASLNPACTHLGGNHGHLPWVPGDPPRLGPQEGCMYLSSASTSWGPGLQNCPPRCVMLFHLAEGLHRCGYLKDVEMG